MNYTNTSPESDRLIHVKILDPVSQQRTEDADGWYILYTRGGQYEGMVSEVKGDIRVMATRHTRINNTKCVDAPSAHTVLTTHLSHCKGPC